MDESAHVGLASFVGALLLLIPLPGAARADDPPLHTNPDTSYPPDIYYSTDFQPMG